jgi:hypothetical protein
MFLEFSKDFEKSKKKIGGVGMGGKGVWAVGG